MNLKNQKERKKPVMVMLKKYLNKMVLKRHIKMRLMMILMNLVFWLAKKVIFSLFIYQIHKVLYRIYENLISNLKKINLKFLNKLNHAHTVNIHKIVESHLRSLMITRIQFHWMLIAIANIYKWVTTKKYIK